MEHCEQYWPICRGALRLCSGYGPSLPFITMWKSYGRFSSCHGPSLILRWRLARRLAKEMPDLGRCFVRYVPSAIGHCQLFLDDLDVHILGFGLP